ncbi:hypothetical protein HBO08_02580 [Pseudomonas rhodesiae]|uniref:phage tail protein n=1 Tax=Pseudomonas rhodesiae TaxID=76760 RepID=UPI0014763EEF|nr:phage tail protein [Pseudomonas rhodesiae]NMZ15904.1 hypothetical protein [Pseudomonas rhodesiae]
MIDPNSQFFAILTAVGEAKQANADALGIPWKLTEMGVGDANGTDPIPDRSQKKLINERRRRPLNKLSIDPANSNILIAEQIIPADEGGWWIREIGLYDGDGDLVAVANCAPSYKPLMSQGSGRTQVVRMNFIVSSAANVVLMIDPAVVLATRKFVTDSITDAINQQDVKQSVLVATTGPIVLAGAQTIDGVAVPVGSRVLVKDQVQGKDNGLYLTTAEIWTRTADADIGSEVTPGLLVHVERGVTNGDTLWHLTTDGPIILGTTTLTFQWAGGQNVPTPAVDDRSKKVTNTESVRAQIESQNQQFPSQVYRKNLLINGNLDIWQRGSSGAVTVANALYTADRWMVFVPAGVTAQWDKTPFTLGKGFNGAKWALSASFTAGSAGSNIRQRIEGVETGAGQTLTASFYLNSTVEQTCTIILRQTFGTGGNVSPDVDHFQDIEVTRDYKKHTVTFNVSSILGKTKGYNNNDYIELIIVSKVSAAHTIVLASAQLEVGSVATEFEKRPLQQELAMCQRYFEKTFSQNITPIDGVDVSGALISVVYQGQTNSSSQPVAAWQFKVEKRAVPSVRLYRPMGDGTNGQWRSGSNAISSANARALIIGTRTVSVDNSDVGVPAQTYYIHATADAEL